MVAGWLNHNELKIVKGIGKTATDTNSAELDPVVVNLMGGPITLEANGWSPNIAAVKNSGVWVDSPIADGRTLLAAPVGNVTEKMGLIITAADYLGVMKQLSSLSQMQGDCRNFWQSQYQIDPVYLLWYASCGAGPQYALLYNIEVAPEYQDSPTPTMHVTVTLEREPYWRGIPPGANPKLWTFYVNKQQIGTNKVLADVGLITKTDDLVYSTVIKNRFEWDSTTYQSALAKNYVDIPASLVPGDAPALVELAIENTNTFNQTGNQVLVGKSSKPVSLTDRTGVQFPQALVFNAGDSVIFASWAKTIDATCGCFSNNSNVNRYLGKNAALALGSYPSFASWSYNAVNTRLVDSNVLRGTYIAYLRCKQLTGASGDVTAALRIQEQTAFILGQAYALPITAAAPAAPCRNRFDWLYLGTFTFPLAAKSYGSPDGRGLNVTTRNLSPGNGTSFGIDVNQTNAAARSIEFLDLVLIPIDENAIYLKSNVDSLSKYFIFDNTGYLKHGETGDIGVLSTPVSATETQMDAIETLGSSLTLTPRANNRLYFLMRRQTNQTPLTYSSTPDSESDFNFRLNIVPRWSGIRDV